MKLKLMTGALTLGLLVGVSGLNVMAGQEKPPAADNTKANQRDRSKAEPTADNAKDNMSDRDIMQKIRKAVMDDKSLSSNAHNAKIIAQNGKVTLKGVVKSPDEKQTLEQKATDVAGAGNVTNELTVKSAK